ncbi:glycoside hydrolase family 10 protein [Fimbriimonas ginsengisoli]|nr:family 10 glycosylhydrolase [Fimbriimonas ginsengisoli]
MLAGPGSQILTPPPMPREFRAAWVATVDNIDWPSKRTLSVSQQKAEMIRILDIAKGMNLNAIVLQVRPSADALYQSKLEPWSEYLTGQQGKAPSPYYDPLEFAVSEAHKRGLELHCWFNPYRALHPAQKGPVVASHISKTNPEIVRRYGSYLWMDPGEPEVQRRSLQVVLDVVKRYDVDGVHIDDYFYPYKEKGPDGKLMDFPDDRSFRRYRSGGGHLARDDWRRKNVDDFIRDLYSGIKQEKRWVKFGISPFGIYRPGYPAGIKAGVDQYADLYADARRWFAEGWCDYFTPQLYWPIHQTAQAYPALLDWWLAQNQKGRHLWPGNYTSLTSPSEKNWPAQEVADQISITRQRGANGNVHFSMKAFLQNYNGITSHLMNGLYAKPALVPASPWLDDRAPNAPKVDVESMGDNQWSLKWRPDGDNDVRFYQITVQVGEKWGTPSVTSADNLKIKQPSGAVTRVAIAAIDRTGNESGQTVVRLR